MTVTALSSPRPQRRTRRRLAARGGHSLLVGVLKVLLPSIAVGLIVMLVVWSQINPNEDHIRIGLTELAPEDIDSVNVVNARYEGVDKKHRPFTVTASRATQVDKQADIVDLTDPKADMTTESGAWLAVSAKSGRYARKADLLDLKGSVSLYHDRGFEFHARSVRVNLKDSTAVSDEPVEGQGPNGQLTAQGLEVRQGGDRILFTGRSKLVIFPDSGDGPAKLPVDLVE
ncbi:MAG: LPS export ABC transporter periplasmic protein LptC [Rhodospirillaceae bacterium]|nr:LPS export ABC transporter periplasmic protein LptC [Rhodospirillaceae bacterium]